MSDMLEQLAFEPGQQVQCKTRFDDIFKGEVVAFDLSNKILILKSPSTTVFAKNHELHFLNLDNVADVQILEEPRDQRCSDKLPSIETKQIQAKEATAIAERLRLIEKLGETNKSSQRGQKPSRKPYNKANY